MTREEARRILGCCGPSCCGEQDVRVAEALRMAEGDPELRAWLEQERAFDRAFAEKLQEGLRVPSVDELWLHRVCEACEGASPAVERPWQEWWRPAVALVAMLLLAVTVAFFFSTPSRVVAAQELPPLIGFLSERHGDFEGFDQVVEAEEEARAFLVGREMPFPGSLPQHPLLAGAKPMGCVVLDFQGVPVSLLCFQVRDGMVHLYVVREGDLAGQAPACGCYCSGVSEYEVWRENGLLFIVASNCEKKR